MVNYKSKYLKYKLKYLNAKNKLIGGMESNTSPTRQQLNIVEINDIEIFFESNNYSIGEILHDNYVSVILKDDEPLFVIKKIGYDFEQYETNDIEKIVERVNFENRVTQIDDRILKIIPEIWVVSFTDWSIGEDFFGSKLDLPGVGVDIRMWEVDEEGKPSRTLQSKDLDFNLKNYIDIKKGTANFIASDYDMFYEFDKVNLNKDEFKKKKEYNLIKNQKITYYFQLYEYYSYKTVQELLNENKLELSDINIIRSEIKEIMEKVGAKNIFYDDFSLDNVLFDIVNKKVILIDLNAFKETKEHEIINISKFNIDLYLIAVEK